MKRTNINAFLRAVALAALYHVLLFLFPLGHTPTYWVAFSFALLSILLGLGACFFYTGRRASLISRHYHMPLQKITLLYMILQLAFSLLIAAFPTSPLWLTITVGCALLIACLFGLVLSEESRAALDNENLEFGRKRLFLRLAREELHNLTGLCHDPAVLAKLRALCEIARLSDPISYDELLPLENNIREQIIELHRDVIAHRCDAASLRIDGLTAMFRQRNEECTQLEAPLHA